MNHFSRDERNRVYEALLHKNGQQLQAIVAIEEMAEITKEITKALRGKLRREQLAEEVADAMIMLEQIGNMFNINDSISSWMDYKIAEKQREVRK